MASIDDRWYRRVNGRLVPTARHGKGMRWRVRYLDPAGREHGKSFARKTDAEKYRDTTAADIVRGTWADPANRKILLADYAREWMASCGGEPTTVEQRRNRVELHIIPALGGLRLAEILPSKVASFVRGLRTVNGDRGPVAPSTARQIHSTLSEILSAAVEDGLITSNAARMKTARRGLPALEERTVIPWTGPQVAAVRAGLPERWRVFCDLGAGLGLRQGEILGLDVGLIEMLPHVVHVRQQLRIVAGRLVLAPPKTPESVRDVPLPEPVAQAIAVHLALFPARMVTLPWRTPDGPARTVRLVLTTDKGEAIRRDIFNPAWRGAVRSAGMTPSRDTGTHQLRHRYASMLIARGIDVRTVAAYLGHRNPSITLGVYSHLMPAAGDRARKAIEDALSCDQAADSSSDQVAEDS